MQQVAAMTMTKNKLRGLKFTLTLAFYGYSTSAYCAFVEELETGFNKIDAGLVGKVVGVSLIAGFGWGAYDTISGGDVKRGVSLAALGLGSGAIANYLIQTFIAAG